MLEIDKDLLTVSEKQQLQDIFRLYFDTWICDDKKIRKLIKLAANLELDSNFITTLADDYINYLPF